MSTVRITAAALLPCLLAACGAAPEPGADPERTLSTSSALSSTNRAASVSIAAFDGPTKAGELAMHTMSSGAFTAFSLTSPTFTATPTHGTAATGPNWEQLVGDFDGDHWTDFADHNLGSGAIFIHLNDHKGGFRPNGTVNGTTAVGGDWQTIVGNFSGSGRADFADFSPSGNMLWIHKNMGGGENAANTQCTITFQPQRTNWGVGLTQMRPGYELLVGDWDGDGFADLAEHDTVWGWIWTARNLGVASQTNVFAPFPSVPTSSNAVGQLRVGASWEVITGDVNRDGKDDWSSHSLSTGELWAYESDGSGIPHGSFPFDVGASSTGSNLRVLGMEDMNQTYCRNAASCPPPMTPPDGLSGIEIMMDSAGNSSASSSSEYYVVQVDVPVNGTTFQFPSLSGALAYPVWPSGLSCDTLQNHTIVQMWASGFDSVTRSWVNVGTNAQSFGYGCFGANTYIPNINMANFKGTGHSLIALAISATASFQQTNGVWVDVPVTIQTDTE